jgi:hypothetical protein
VTGRPPPELHAALTFEADRPIVRLVCFTDSDEQRLRAWLTENPARVLDLVHAVLVLLDNLLGEEDAA